MSQDLRIALVQADTTWHDPESNRRRFEAEFQASCRGCDLVILPETFSTGFSSEAVAWAETMEGETVAWVRAQAKELGAAITGSVQIRVGDGVRNRLLWAMADGRFLHYDKRHLFRMAGEHQHYVAGRERLLVDFRGWRICPLVCYDLRFPVFARNRFDRTRPGDHDYDLLVFVANWPAARHRAWQTLLQARAMENLSYVAGVNRVGTDGNGIAYAGGSAVLDFMGEPVEAAGDGVETLVTTLSMTRLREYRERFPAHLDADRFELDPPI
ncbi:MAG: amidohydrolase [Gemmatimonadales bacterium]|nr:MAG: amidohydrolase [Gemmatimonadales bacterium]